MFIKSTLKESYFYYYFIIIIIDTTQSFPHKTEN